MSEDVISVADASIMSIIFANIREAATFYWLQYQDVRLSPSLPRTAGHRRAPPRALDLHPQLHQRVHATEVPQLLAEQGR